LDHVPQVFEQNHYFFGYARYRFCHGLTSQIRHQYLKRCAVKKSSLQFLACRRSFSGSRVIEKNCAEKPIYRFLWYGTYRADWLVIFRWWHWGFALVS